MRLLLCSCCYPPQPMLDLGDIPVGYIFDSSLDSQLRSILPDTGSRWRVHPSPQELSLFPPDEGVPLVEGQGDML